MPETEAPLVEQGNDPGAKPAPNPNPYLDRPIENVIRERKQAVAYLASLEAKLQPIRDDIANMDAAVIAYTEANQTTHALDPDGEYTIEVTQRITKVYDDSILEKILDLPIPAELRQKGIARIPYVAPVLPPPPEYVLKVNMNSLNALGKKYKEVADIIERACTPTKSPKRVVYTPIQKAIN